MTDAEWLKVCDAQIAKDFAPPSNLPIWKWWEANIQLGNDSPIQGRYSTDLTPQTRWLGDAVQDPYCRRVTGMLSAQSSKTQAGINTLMWCICEAPGTAMWVAASKESAEEFGQKRLYPALRRCEKTSALLPGDRNKQSKRLIQLDSMNLMMRGANSRIGLQSDPVRYIFCDERREWKPGRMDMLRKRTTTFHNSLEFSMGTPGAMDDELHIDYMEGTQTMAHFRCPHCSHSQPFRFSRLATVLHPQPRECGGIVWDKNDVTKPGGKYNFDQLRKTVRYQCENPKCGHLFHNADKYRLISTIHPHDYNQTPQRQSRSFNWNQLCMPWAQCDWQEIAVRFIRAQKQFRKGNQEPFIEVITEDLGEPWDEPTFFRTETIVLDGQGYTITGADLAPGKFWTEEKTRFLSVDVQLDHMWAVCRAFASTGESRLVAARRLDTWADVRSMQTGLGVEDARTVVDRKYRTDEVDEHVAYYGWWGTMGSDSRGFSHYKAALNRKIVLPYSPPAGGKYFEFTKTEPGKTEKTVVRSRARWFTWSNPTIKTHLWRLQQGRGLYWGVPTDAPKHYVDQIQGERLKEKLMPDGKRIWKWTEVGRVGCHSRDCECMILTCAIIDQLLASGSVADEVSGEPAAEG